MRFELDPRTKLILMILVTVSAFFVKNRTVELIFILSIALLAFLGGTYKRSIGFLLVYALTYVLLSLSVYIPQAPASMIVIISAVIRKMLPPMMFAFCVLMPTRTSALIAAMQKLRLPRQITIPVAVGLRFFPTAREEMRAIRNAAKLRGINFSLQNLFVRPGIMFEGAVVPIMLRSASIAEELSASAISRGSDCGKKRTSIEVLQLRIQDYICLCVFAALLVLCVWGEVILP